jgi:hypothetical protein
MIFPSPEISDFFDNRMLISWKISQPKNYPPLENINFTIAGEPNLIFEPPQKPMIEIEALNGNEIIINWVIIKPKAFTEITLKLESPTIKETQTIVVNP